MSSGDMKSSRRMNRVFSRCRYIKSTPTIGIGGAASWATACGDDVGEIWAHTAVEEVATSVGYAGLSFQLIAHEGIIVKRRR